MMISIAIVEDNEKDFNKLEGLLNRFAYDENVELHFQRFSNGEDFLQNYKFGYDVVFLDIQLPLTSGLDVASMLRKIDESIPIIFVTEIKKYALMGYKVNALDYFIKPIVYSELKMRLLKISDLKQNQVSQIVVHISGKGDMVFSQNDIYYIEIRDKELTYHTNTGSYSTRSVGLSELEKKLSKFGFIRSSASFLVNLRWCTEIKNEYIVIKGIQLKLSKKFKKNLNERICEYYAQNIK